MAQDKPNIVHAQNVFRLIRPDRFGVDLTSFCHHLNRQLHKAYSSAELIKLQERAEPSHGLRLDVLRDDDGKEFSIRSQKTDGKNLGRKDYAELLVYVVDDPTGMARWNWNVAKLRELVAVPLQFCLSRFAPDLAGTYTVYAHTFTSDKNQDCFRVNAEEEPSYVGITKRGWPTRWNEHLIAANSGSPYRFHEAIRRFGKANPVHHEVLLCGLDEATAMKAEELFVEKYSLYPNGFNMIPGGEAGIRYLASKGFPKIDWEHREKVIREFIDGSSRKGLPNPLLSAIWRDDDYAASIICGNPNNFTKSEVHQIRFLADIGKSAAEIAISLGCSEQRVKNLLQKTTYSRVA